MWSHRKMAVCLFTFLSFLTTGTLTIVLLKMTSHLVHSLARGLGDHVFRC